MKSILYILLFFNYNIVVAHNTDSLYHFATDKNKNDTDRITTYHILAQKSTTLDTALIFIKKAFDLAEATNNTNEMCKTLLKKGLVYSNFSETDKEITCYKEALKYAKQASSSNLTPSILVNLGIVYSTQSKFELALETLNKAKTIAHQNDNLDDVLKALNSIGNIYINLGDYSKAQIAFLEAFEINKILKNTFFETVLTVNIGNIYFYLSQYEKAIEYYYRTLEIAEKNGFDRFINPTYGNIGIIYQKLKKYDEAINNTQLSIDYYLKNNDRYNTSLAYNTLGIIYSAQNNLDSAMYYFDKALNLKLELTDTAGLSLIYNNMADVLIQENKLVQAEIILNQSITIAKQFSSNYDLAHAYYFLGDLNALNKKYNLSVISYENAIKYAKNNNQTKVNAYNKLYEHYKERKNHGAALKYYELYTFLSDSINGEESKLKIEEIETIYEVDKKDGEIKMLQQTQELETLKHEKAQERNKTTILLISLGSGIFILLLIIVFIRYRQKQQNKIYSIEKRGLKIETQMLRSQMNPHFIFNSLNSIQSFISGNETIDAERYLAKFAKLMRHILDNSRHSFISLENEVETLELYLELEKLRFNNRFNYTININSVDDEFTLIPPMLAQPYIENAILHGVSTINNGIINIDYEQIGEKIICTIDDNGIGRQKSAELKPTSSTKKSSLGIKVTQERIELLSEDFKLDLTTEIIDKKDDNEETTGTKVVIEMPWNE